MASLVRCVVLFLAVAFPFQEAVAQAVPLTLVPISYAPAAATPAGGLTGIATFEASGGATAANASYYARAVTFSEGQVANAARARAIPGAGAASAAGAAAIAAAMLGAGYLLDQYTGQINSSAAVPAKPLGPTAWMIQDGSSRMFSTLGDATGTTVASTGNKVGTLIYSNNGATAFVQTLPAGSAVFNLQPTTALSINANPSRAAVPATDHQVAQAILNHPNTWPYLFSNPNTGAVPNVGPIADAAAALYPEVAAARGVDPNVVPLPDVTVGEQTGDDPAPSHIPSFCGWAAKLCSWIDWTQQNDDDQDVPLPEKPVVAATYVSGIGSGSCPSPKTVSLSSGNFSLSYQPICDFANAARPIVILFAFLAAAYILAGAKNA